MGKGEKERVCLFASEAKEHLLKYFASRTDNFQYCFVSRENNRWSIGAIQKYVLVTAKKAGIEKRLHPHLFRHGCAMFLLENGVPLDEIQRVLGHSNINTTQIYARTSLNRVKRCIERIQ